MPWEPQFETGISQVDIQHRRLFDRLETVGRLAAQQAPYSEAEREEIKRSVYDLEDYSEAHFTLEETLMQENEYPGLEDHIKDHERFTATAKEMLVKLDKVLSADDKEIKSFVRQLYEFLQHWLKHHILVKDHQYVPYIHND